MSSSKSRADFIAWAVSTVDKKASTSQQTLSLSKWAEYAYETTLNRIARKYDFAVLYDEDTSLATVAGTHTYTLPSRTHRIYRLVYEWDNSSYDIHGITPLEFDQDFPYPTSMGNSQPRIYCRRNETTIDIAPPPSEAKTLRLYRSLWPTSDGTSNMEFEHIDDIVHAGMVGELYHQYGLDSDAETWWKKFNTDLDQAILRDNDNPDANLIHRGFRRRGSYGNAVNSVEHWRTPFILRNP